MITPQPEGKRAI